MFVCFGFKSLFLKCILPASLSDLLQNTFCNVLDLDIFKFNIVYKSQFMQRLCLWQKAYLTQRLSGSQGVLRGNLTARSYRRQQKGSIRHQKDTLQTQICSVFDLAIRGKLLQAPTPPIFSSVKQGYWCFILYGC